MIHLARHGHVENPANLLYGNRPGFSLSALGRAQSAALGRRLAGVRLGAVYSSPLERAVGTAAIAARRPPAQLPELSDWEPRPDWVGLPWETIPLQDPELWREFREHPWIDARPAARALRALAAAHPGQPVLVVGHQDPLRAAMHELRPIPGARLRDDPFPHCGLRVLHPATWRLIAAWDPPGASAWPTG